MRGNGADLLREGLEGRCWWMWEGRTLEVKDRFLSPSKGPGPHLESSDPMVKVGGMGEVGSG